MLTQLSKLCLAAFASVILAGCASSPGNSTLDSVNERVSGFNHAVDRTVIRPVADLYDDAVPRPVRGGIHNMLANLRSPTVFGNEILQGEFEEAATTLGSFAVNSTLGVGGVIDWATRWGLPRHQTDFGITLGKLGVGPGPCLVLPLVGPSDPRDLAGSVADGYMSPIGLIHYQGSSVVGYVRNGVGTLDARSRKIPANDGIEREPAYVGSGTCARYLAAREYLVDGESDVQKLADK